MSKQLMRDLGRVQQQMLTMAGIVEDSIHKAIRSVYERDLNLAKSTIQIDDEIDDFDNDITEKCLTILALHQPVACDLRRIVSVMMITNALERMADLAVHISERAIVLAKPPLVFIPERLPKMADVTIKMVGQSLQSFANMDPKLARQVIRLDDEVDGYNNQIIDELQQIMYSSRELITPALSLFSIVRHLERIADHATNIAEDVLFLIDGESVRHKPESIQEED